MITVPLAQPPGDGKLEVGGFERAWDQVSGWLRPTVNSGVNKASSYFFMEVNFEEKLSAVQCCCCLCVSMNIV